MTPTMHSIQAIGAISFAGLAWLGETAAQHIPGIPEWVTALGFPVAMLVAVIYALVATHRAYQGVQEARISDRDAMEERLREMLAKGQESREKLLVATERQTVQLEAQTKAIEQLSKQMGKGGAGS
jgi:mannitol-1-phosphate/altronate dehydrogenase